jgi:hypothetical protein
MVELMRDEIPHQLAQVVAMNLLAGLVCGVRGMGVGHIQLGAGNPHTGRMVMAHETVQPMMWMVERAAEIEQNRPGRTGHRPSLAALAMRHYK